MSRTMTDGMTVEDPRWQVAPIVREVPWDHEPVGPFRCQMWNVNGRPGTKTAIAATLAEAVQTFSIAMMPPSTGQAAAVIDESFKVIVGWHAAEAMMRDLGVPGWWGCEAGFKALRWTGRFEERDVEGWEMAARIFA